MGKKVITCELSVESIDAAIKEIEAYKQELADKLRRLQTLIAERVTWSVTSGFNNATFDVISGTPEPNDVTVELDDSGNVSVIIARGKQAVFIEFGAGVYNNGPKGSSPHPWTETNPTFLIGEYGMGNGARNAWAYYNGEKGKENLVVTHGTPAAMPMYNGYKTALAIIGDLAREVFGE